MLKLIQGVNRFVDYLNALIFVVITVGVLLAVLGRYIFRVPLPAAMELAYFAMLWCAFLKTGQVLFEDRHIGMALLKDRLKGRSYAGFGAAVNAVVMVPSLYLGVFAGKMAWEAWVFGWSTSGGLPIPKCSLYGIMSLGSFYLVLIAAYKIWNYICAFRDDKHGS